METEKKLNGRELMGEGMVSLSEFYGTCIKLVIHGLLIKVSYYAIKIPTCSGNYSGAPLIRQ